MVDRTQYDLEDRAFPTATSTGGLKTETTKDRKVIADAIRAGTSSSIAADREQS